MDYSATKLSHSDPLTDVRAARLLEALDAERTRAVSPGGAWQAMGTAPRDGTPILVWVRWQNAPAGPAIVQWDAVGRGLETSRGGAAHRSDHCHALDAA